jgi:GAF domain-containing protein
MSLGNREKLKAVTSIIMPMREETRLFQELYLLVTDLNQSTDQQEIINKALAGILDVLNLDRASLLLFDDQDVMRFRAWLNLSDSYRRAVDGHSPWTAEEQDPQPVLVPDIYEDDSMADYRPIFEREGIHALGFIPLMNQTRLIGKFMLYYDHPHTFSREEVHLAQIVADHVVHALERHQSQQSLRDYGRQRSFLAELGQHALNNYFRLSELMQLIVEQAAEVLNTDLCELLALEPDEQSLRLIAGAGWEEGVVGEAVVKVGAGSQAGYTLNQHHPVIVRDFGRETRFEVAELLHSHHAVSGMTVIIQGEKGPFGVLGVHTTRLRRFTQDEASFLHVLANILAAAIQQNQALSALQAANNLLEARVVKRTALLNQEIAQRELAEAALKREGEYIQLLQEVTELANDANSIHEAFRSILDKICIFTGWEVAHIYIQASDILEDGGPDELVSSNIWRCGTNEHFDMVQRVTAESRVKRGIGWIGQVFESGEPVWITISEKAEQARRKPFQSAGIKAGLAFPVLVGDEVTAVMEFFTAGFQEPEKDLLGVMAQIGTQMGRIVERERARKIAKRNEDNLRELAGDLIRSQEAERRRISHELHDEIGQNLSALKLELDMLAVDEENEKLKGLMGRARQLAKTSMEEVQLLSYDLRPPELDTIGLEGALHDLCQDIAKRVDFAIEYKGSDRLPANIPDSITLSLYRALQTSLNNVAEHSGVAEVGVCLKYEDDQVSLSVTENGSGDSSTDDAAAAGTNHSLTLFGLSERFAQLGGQVTMTAVENGGRILLAVLPVS